MIAEILSCLSLLTSDIDYGNPKKISDFQLIQDSQRTDVFYITSAQDSFRCTSSIPLNQNIQIYFPVAINGLPQQIQYNEVATPKSEDAQKSKKQVYKAAPNKLFKHEKINTFSAPPFSQTKAVATCSQIKKNSIQELNAFENSVIKSAKLEISDTLADWSEFMDSEDYGYDKSTKEREHSKRLFTEKLKKNLILCQKNPDLELAVKAVTEKLDLYLVPTSSTSTKVLAPKTQVNKTSVPANQ